MNYLLSQIILCLLAAFILGAIIGWLWKNIACKKCHEDLMLLQEKYNILKKDTNKLNLVDDEFNASSSVNNDTPKAPVKTAKLVDINELNKKEVDVPQIQKTVKKENVKPVEKIKAVKKAKPIQKTKKPTKKVKKETPVEDISTDLFADEDFGKPAFLHAPRKGVADDLKRIKGVGKVLEGKLNDLGVYHFAQITDWNDDNVKWMDVYMKFPGRIVREDWIAQSKLLAKGKQTKFSKKVDKNNIYD